MNKTIYKRIGLLLLLIFFMLGSAFAVLTDAVDYYSMDNGDISGSTLTDLGSDGFDGNIGGAITTGVDGVVRQGFEFDETATSVLTPSSSIVLNTATGFTVNFWIKFNDLADASEGFFSSGGSEKITADPPNTRTFVRSLSGNAFITLPGSAFSNTEYVMWTYIGNSTDSKIKVFIDGVEAADSGATTFTTFTLDEIGMDSSNAGRGLDGFLDEFAVYDRELTQAEITELFNTGNGFNPYNPLATVNTNLSSLYAIGNFSIDVSTSDGANMNFSYVLDGASEISLANNTNFTTLTLTGQSLGLHNLSLKGVRDGDVFFNNNTFEIQPFQFFRFNNTNTGQFIQNYTFGGVASVGNLVTLDARDFSAGVQPLTFTKLGFTDSTFNITFNNTMQLNETFFIAVSTIVINIFDRQTLNLLTGFTTITLEATVGFLGNTTTGQLNISDTSFISEPYQILAEHAGFESETVFFNFNNQEIINVNIFMLNSSNAGVITLIVKNTLSQLVESAVCSALEWNPTTSAFITVAQGLTNVNGETRLNIELNTKIYKFSCTKQTFTTVTNAQIIQVDDTELNIILNDIILAPTTLFPNLVTSLTNTSLNVTHQLITYTFADSDGLVTEACLQAFAVNGNRESFISQNCVNTPTGSILLTVDINQTFDTQMKGVLTTDAVTNYVTDTLIFKGTGDISYQFAKIGLDVLIPVIFILLGLGLGIVMGQISIAVILMALGAWLAVVFVPTVMAASIATFISVIVGLMLWGGFTRK